MSNLTHMFVKLDQNINSHFNFNPYLIIVLNYLNLHFPVLTVAGAFNKAFMQLTIQMLWFQT